LDREGKIETLTCTGRRGFRQTGRRQWSGTVSTFGFDRESRRTGLIAHTIFYADEVRTVEEFRIDTGLASMKEVELAKALIQALTKPFEPDKFKNQFRNRLNQLISSRTAEHQITPAQVPQSGKVIDIMDTPRRSLAEVKSIKQPEQVPPQANDKPSKRRGNKRLA
jgi:DNA end-binding protein Ku